MLECLATQHLGLDEERTGGAQDWPTSDHWQGTSCKGVSLEPPQGFHPAPGLHDTSQGGGVLGGGEAFRGGAELLNLLPYLAGLGM